MKVSSYFPSFSSHVLFPEVLSCDPKNEKIFSIRQRFLSRCFSLLPIRSSIKCKKERTAHIPFLTVLLFHTAFGILCSLTIIQTLLLSIRILTWLTRSTRNALPSLSIFSSMMTLFGLYATTEQILLILAIAGSIEHSTSYLLAIRELLDAPLSQKQITKIFQIFDQIPNRRKRELFREIATHPNIFLWIEKAPSQKRRADLIEKIAIYAEEAFLFSPMNISLQWIEKRVSLQRASTTDSIPLVFAFANRVHLVYQEVTRALIAYQERRTHISSWPIEIMGLLLAYLPPEEQILVSRVDSSAFKSMFPSRLLVHASPKLPLLDQTIHLVEKIRKALPNHPMLQNNRRLDIQLRLLQQNICKELFKSS